MIDCSHSLVDKVIANGILNWQCFFDDATLCDVCKCADGDMKSWAIAVLQNRPNFIGSIGSN